VFLLKPELTEIEEIVTIPATPEEVYEAFMDPKKHAKFTRSKATGNPVVGGEFTAWDGYIKGKNLELKEGKLIVQEWTNTDFPEGYPSSRFELALKKVPKGTEMHMVHSKIPASQAEELREGWTEFYWEPLRNYFSKQAKKPIQKLKIVKRKK
jgi:activator of HSP90 ATPase